MRIDFFLTFVLAVSVLEIRAIQTTNSVAVVLARYKSFFIGSSSVYRSAVYEFRFCRCPRSDIGNPEDDGECSCSSLVEGERLSRAPVSYSPKCLTGDPFAQPRCLAATIPHTKPIQPNQGHIYAQISVNDMAITHPAWQEIGPNSRRKRRAQLTCAINKAQCNDCHLCRNGYIELDYITKESESEEPIRASGVLTDRRFGFTKPPIRLFQNRPKKSRSRIPIPKRTMGFSKNNLRTSTKSDKINVPQLRNKIISLHNKYRSEHSVEPLRGAPKLDRAAQRWADKLARQQGCLVHDKDRSYGENLYTIATTQPMTENQLAKSVVDLFYAEGNNYNYRRFRLGDYFKYGHFTQMIWKETRRIGVGVGVSKFNGRRRKSCQPPFASTMIYVVVKYDPPGNVQAKIAYFANVLPPN